MSSIFPETDSASELRNPLSAVVGSCEFLLQRAASYCQRLQTLSTELSANDRAIVDGIRNELLSTDDLHTIVNCTTHMTKIIGDVLLISKIEGDHMQLNESVCKPLEEIESVLRMFQRDMEAKNLSKLLRVDESWQEANRAWVLLDAARFKQILINLLNKYVISFLRLHVLTSQCHQIQPGQHTQRGQSDGRS